MRLPCALAAYSLFGERVRSLTVRSAARRHASRSSRVARALAAELAVSRISIWVPSASTETKAGLSARTASTTRRAVVGSGNEPRTTPPSSRLRFLPSRGRRWLPSWGLRSGSPTERSGHDRGGMRSANRFRLGSLLQVVHDRGPDLPVVPGLVLEVVLSEETGEGGLANGIPAPREATGVVAEHPQVVLQLAGDVALDHEEGRGVLAVQIRHVVDLEDPSQFLDRRQVLVDPQVHPAVVASHVAPAFPDDIERRGLHPPSVASLALSGGERGEESVENVPARRLVGPRHRADHVRSKEDVPLASE